MCVDYVFYICASRMRREKMGDNWRSNSAQFGAIFRPSHYFVIQRKTRTRIKRERERNNGKTTQEEEEEEDEEEEEEGVLRRMDPAATLVVLLVVLVFGFLFGNIAL